MDKGDSILDAQERYYGKGRGPPMLPHGDDPKAVPPRRSRKRPRKRNIEREPPLPRRMTRATRNLNESELPDGFPPELAFRALAAYATIRTLSIQLRLSPFTARVFLRSLVLPFPNRLLGRVHTQILRILLQGYHWKDTVPLAAQKKRKKDEIKWTLRAGDNLKYLDTFTWPLFFDDYCHLNADVLYQSIHDTKNYLVMSTFNAGREDEQDTKTSDQRPSRACTKQSTAAVYLEEENDDEESADEAVRQVDSEDESQMGDIADDGDDDDDDDDFDGDYEPVVRPRKQRKKQKQASTAPSRSSSRDDVQNLPTSPCTLKERGPSAAESRAAANPLVYVAPSQMTAAPQVNAQFSTKDSTQQQKTGYVQKEFGFKHKRTNPTSAAAPDYPQLPQDRQQMEVAMQQQYLAYRQHHAVIIEQARNDFPYMNQAAMYYPSQPSVPGYSFPNPYAALPWDYAQMNVGPMMPNPYAPQYQASANVAQSLQTQTDPPPPTGILDGSGLVTQQSQVLAKNPGCGQSTTTSTGSSVQREMKYTVAPPTQPNAARPPALSTLVSEENCPGPIFHPGREDVTSKYGWLESSADDDCHDDGLIEPPYRMKPPTENPPFVKECHFVERQPCTNSEKALPRVKDSRNDSKDDPESTLEAFVQGEAIKVRPEFEHAASSQEAEPFVAIDHPEYWAHFSPLKKMRAGLPYFRLSVEEKLVILEFLLDELLSIHFISEEFALRRNSALSFKHPYGPLPTQEELRNLVNQDECAVCAKGGEMVCCDFCVFSFHYACVGINNDQALPEKWLCPECKLRDPAMLGPLHGYRKSSLDWFSPQDLPIDPRNAGPALRMGGNNEFLVVQGYVFSRSTMRGCEDTPNASLHPTELAKQLEILDFKAVSSWPLNQIGADFIFRNIDVPRPQLYSTEESFDPSRYCNVYGSTLPNSVTNFADHSRMDYEFQCEKSRVQYLSTVLSDDMSKDQDVIDALLNGTTIFNPFDMIVTYVLSMESDLLKACLLVEDWKTPENSPIDRAWRSGVRGCKSVHGLSRQLVRLVDSTHPRAFKAEWLHGVRRRSARTEDTSKPGRRFDLLDGCEHQEESLRRHWKVCPVSAVNMLLAKSSRLLGERFKPPKLLGACGGTDRRKRKRKSGDDLETVEMSPIEPVPKKSHPSAATQGAKLSVEVGVTSGSTTGTNTPSPNLDMLNAKMSGQPNSMATTFAPSDHVTSKPQDSPGGKEPGRADEEINVANGHTKSDEKHLKVSRRVRSLRSSNSSEDATASDASVSYVDNQMKQITEAINSMVREPKEMDWAKAGRKLFPPMGCLPKPVVRQLGRFAGARQAPFVTYSDSYEVGQVAWYHVWRKRVLACSSFEELVLLVRILGSFLDNATIKSCKGSMQRLASSKARLSSEILHAQHDIRSGLIYYLTGRTGKRASVQWVTSLKVDLGALVYESSKRTRNRTASMTAANATSARRANLFQESDFVLIFEAHKESYAKLLQTRRTASCPVAALKSLRRNTRMKLHSASKVEHGFLSSETLNKELCKVELLVRASVRAKRQEIADTSKVAPAKYPPPKAPSQPPGAPNQQTIAPNRPTTVPATVLQAGSMGLSQQQSLVLSAQNKPMPQSVPFQQHPPRYSPYEGLPPGLRHPGRPADARQGSNLFPQQQKMDPMLQERRIPQSLPPAAVPRKVEPESAMRGHQAASQSEQVVTAYENTLSRHVEQHGFNFSMLDLQRQREPYLGVINDILVRARIRNKFPQSLLVNLFTEAEGRVIAHAKMKAQRMEQALQARNMQQQRQSFQHASRQHRPQQHQHRPQHHQHRPQQQQQRRPQQHQYRPQAQQYQYPHSSRFGPARRIAAEHQARQDSGGSARMPSPISLGQVSSDPLMDDSTVEAIVQLFGEKSNEDRTAAQSSRGPSSGNSHRQQY